jgi:hypothetical protein
MLARALDVELAATTDDGCPTPEETTPRDEATDCVAHEQLRRSTSVRLNTTTQRN